MRWRGPVFTRCKLQTYLTAGPKESRAWTIHQGDTAPKAAGVIHTDFEKGFIKAEIVSYDDLIDAGSMAAAKSAGKVRMEGKDYVMADGDVVEFRPRTSIRRKGCGRTSREVCGWTQRLACCPMYALLLLSVTPVLRRRHLRERYPFVPVEIIVRRFSVSKSMDLFMRDGFIDRYKGNRLINPGVLRLLHVVLGDDFPAHPNWKVAETHFAFWEYVPDGRSCPAPQPRWVRRQSRTGSQRRC